MDVQKKGLFVMKYRVRLLLVIAIAGGVYLSVMYINPYGGIIALSEAVLQLSGSRGHFAMEFAYTELAAFTMRLFPAFLFEMYAGIMLYRHFCTASSYVFSRYPHRVRWYLREAAWLGGAAGMFHIFLLAAAVLVTVCRYELQIDRAGIELLIYHFLLQTLWVYIMAMSVNLLAVYFGSSAAYTVAISVQTVCIVLLLAVDVLARSRDDMTVYGKLLIWNPIARLILGWYGGYLEEAELYRSVAVFLLLGIVVTAVGAVAVKKRDLLISNMETGE